MSAFQPEGNYYDKYGSKNFIVKHIMNGFFSSMAELLHVTPENGMNVLEAGCGEGHVSNFIYNAVQPRTMSAFDISEKVIRQAKHEYPDINFNTGSIYDISADDNTYDLVVGSEVLEHLEKPELALKEMVRVSKRYILVSVPREPIWRMLNMARLKYISDMGNTPGHIQHWSKNGFVSFIESAGGGQEYALEVLEIKTPLPWTMVLAEKN